MGVGVSSVILLLAGLQHTMTDVVAPTGWSTSDGMPGNKSHGTSFNLLDRVCSRSGTRTRCPAGAATRGPPTDGNAGCGGVGCCCCCCSVSSVIDSSEDDSGNGTDENATSSDVTTLGYEERMDGGGTGAVGVGRLLLFFFFSLVVVVWLVTARSSSAMRPQPSSGNLWPCSTSQFFFLVRRPVKKSTSGRKPTVSK